MFCRASLNTEPRILLLKTPKNPRPQSSLRDLLFKRQNSLENPMEATQLLLMLFQFIHSRDLCSQVQPFLANCADC